MRSLNKLERCCLEGDAGGLAGGLVVAPRAPLLLDIDERSSTPPLWNRKYSLYWNRRRKAPTMPTRPIKLLKSSARVVTWDTVVVEKLVSRGRLKVRVTAAAKGCTKPPGGAVNRAMGVEPSRRSPRAEVPRVVSVSRVCMGSNPQVKEDRSFPPWATDRLGGKARVCTSPPASTARASMYRDWQV